MQSIKLVLALTPSLEHGRSFFQLFDQCGVTTKGSIVLSNDTQRHEPRIRFVTEGNFRGLPQQVMAERAHFI